MARFSLGDDELRPGNRLPELRADYLNRQAASLPQDASGRAALLLFGFTYQSRFPVEAWAKRFREKFGKDPQVTFFEIPMIGGVARLGKWFIDGGMRRGTPKEDHDNVITVYGGTRIWKQRLGVKDEDVAYLVLLNKRGNVAWRHSGPFDESSFAALAHEVGKLTSRP